MPPMVFDFEEFLDAVFRAFAADAALLHAAERGDLGRDDALVDARDAAGRNNKSAASRICSNKPVSTGWLRKP
jgi:hypothetical protein